ncbi:MAG: type II secretion system F family protein, partial [Pseudomonadota bacterium]
MIEKLTSPENMAVISVTFSVFMLILSMAWPYFRNDPLEGRMKSVALEREKLRAQERAKQANAQQKKGERIGAKKAEASSLIKNIVEKLNLRTALADENTEAMLVHAGYRGSKPLFVFLALRFMLPIGFLAITALYCLFIAERTPDDTMTIAIKCLVAGAIGF